MKYFSEALNEVKLSVGLFVGKLSRIWDNVILVVILVILVLFSIVNIPLSFLFRLLARGFLSDEEFNEFEDLNSFLRGELPREESRFYDMSESKCVDRLMELEDAAVRRAIEYLK